MYYYFCVVVPVSKLVTLKCVKCNTNDINQFFSNKILKKGDNILHLSSL